MAQMSDFKESEILNETIKSHLMRQVNSEMRDIYGEVTEHDIYMNMTSVTSATVEIMMIFRDPNSVAHIIYVMLTYPVDNDNLTTKALLNSPVLKELHEVRYDPSEDPMRFYVREVSKLRRSAAREEAERKIEQTRAAFGIE